MFKDNGLEDKLSKKSEEETVEKAKHTTDEQTRCPECNSKHLVKDYKRAELVCENCGLVLEENLIDPGPDWRAYDTDQREKLSHTGAAIRGTVHDGGLYTEIGKGNWDNRDAYGKKIPAKEMPNIQRMRKWQRRSRIQNAVQRNLVFAFNELIKYISQMGLPKDGQVHQTAAEIYKKAVYKNIIRGRSIEGMLSASLYAACRACKVPRTLDEIAEVTRMSRRELGRNYRFLNKNIKLMLTPTSPEDYISRFCSELRFKPDSKVPNKIRELLSLAKNYEKNNLTSGKGAQGIAGAVIYMASVLCKEPRTQREIAEIAGVTEVTIRNRYRELDQKLETNVKAYL